jgi:hypothetical protein
MTGFRFRLSKHNVNLWIVPLKMSLEAQPKSRHILVLSKGIADRSVESNAVSISSCRSSARHDRKTVVPDALV